MCLASLSFFPTFGSSLSSNTSLVIENISQIQAATQTATTITSAAKHHSSHNMASPQPSQSGLGKRKIDDGPSDDEDEGLFMSDDESAENVSDADNYYDETKEEYPKCAAYDPRYSSIKSRVDGLCMDISEMLQRSGCSTESVLDMLARVAEVSCVPETKRPIIGLLAAAGEGQCVGARPLTESAS